MAPKGSNDVCTNYGLDCHPDYGALYLGRWLDAKQGTEPLYFLSITAGAFIISCIGIGTTGIRYIRQIEEEDKKNKEKNESRQRKSSIE